MVETVDDRVCEVWKVTQEHLPWHLPSCHRTYLPSSEDGTSVT